MKPLEIFRPGTHTDSSGRTVTFGPSDLMATARAYNPNLHEAPLVVGHPETNHPAYGWVASLSCRAGALEALPHQVDSEFADLVNQGRFKNISASFWLPDAANNPVPGAYYLRHVGFLGAAAPAVKGLRRPEFSEDPTGIISFVEHCMSYQTPDLDPALVSRYARDLQFNAASMGQSLSFSDATTEARNRLGELTRPSASKPKRQADNDVIQRLAETLQKIARKDGQDLSWDEALRLARTKIENS